MSSVQSASAYFCPSCKAPIPSNHRRKTCPKCYSVLADQVLDRIRSEQPRIVEATPMRRVGWVLLFAGLALTGGAGIVYLDFDGKSSRQSVNAALAYGTGGYGRDSALADRLRGQRDGTIPWIVAGGLVSLVGAGLVVAGVSSAPQRKCPRCAELVLLEANKCRHCREDI